MNKKWKEMSSDERLHHLAVGGAVAGAFVMGAIVGKVLESNYGLTHKLCKFAANSDSGIVYGIKDINGQKFDYFVKKNT